MRRTPLNKLWASSATGQPKPVPPPPRPIGDLKSNPLMAMQSAVGDLGQVEQAPPQEEPVVVVEDPKPEPPPQAPQTARAATPKVRRAVYADGRFKVARLSGRIAHVTNRLSIHNYMPDW